MFVRILTKRFQKLVSRLGLVLTITGTTIASEDSTSYSDWIENYPTLSSSERYAMASPTNDGIPNLFKFALDIDPQQSSQEGMPIPVLQETSEGAYLAFDIPLNETAVSSNLLGWRTTHLNETWSDGEHSRQDLPASATWFSSRPQSTLTSDSSGMAQKIEDVSGQVTTYFTQPGEVVNLEVGETLRLRFKITFRGTDYTNTAYLRFGLFNTSMNSRLNDHGQGLSNAHFNNATGYALMIADITEGSTVHLRDYNGSATDNLGDLLNNYKTSTEFQPTDSFYSTWGAETTHNVVFALTRTSEDQMHLYTRLTSADNKVLYTLSIRDSVANNHEFDTFSLMSHRFNGIDFHLSEVQIWQEPNSGMMVFPETSKTLESDSWQPVAPMYMNHLSASHTSTELPTEDEAKRFIRLRADAIERLEQPRFVDRTADLGLPYVGGRVAWIDFNNDEWTDLIAGGRIFINNQGAGFTQIKGGLGSVVAADFNNDGWNDLYSITKRKIYKNVEGTGVVEVTLPEFPTVYSSEAATWGDFNNNGLLDLYVSGYEDWNNQITYPDFLLLNQGDESFQKTQIPSTNRARGTTTSDFDQDGDLDIYVSNYRLQQNLLWKNDGNANFTNAAGSYNATASAGHSIGAAWGDFNNSGYFDLFAGNFAHPNRGQPVSRFLRNTGPEGNFHFEDIGPQGVYFQESYASPTAADFNNDGKLDLMFTTVYGVATYSIPNFPALFMNQGNFIFDDVTESSGLDNLAATYQAAWADYNNDGFMDLYIAGRLFENQGNHYNWLKVKLRGDGNEINRSAVGAQVRINLGEETLSRQVETGTGNGNQNDLTLHFGLGQHEGPFDLEIFWPDGSQSTQEVGAANQLIVIDYPE